MARRVRATQGSDEEAVIFELILVQNLNRVGILVWDVDGGFSTAEPVRKSLEPADGTLADLDIPL